MMPEPGRNIDAIRLSVLPLSGFFSGSGNTTFVKGVLLGLCGFAGAVEPVVGGAGAGRMGTSGAGLVGTLVATSSTDVQVVAANTGLLINGRAVDPGFNGGNMGAAASLTSELNRVLFCDTLHLCIFDLITFVLIATVGIHPGGGGGADFVGSASLD